MSNIEILKDILYQEELEKVSPKIEAFRPKIIGGTCPDHIKIKGARGGRGSGAKSWGIISLIVQLANIVPLRIACLREFQKSLEESVYHLVEDTINRLRYPGWNITKEYINSPCGSHIIFRGLKDYHAISQAKGLEKFDIFFIEEAATVSIESLNILVPTLVRTKGAQLWFAYNPENEFDPITEKIWNRNREDALCIELRPGREDNPWWNDALDYEMKLDFEYDPDEAMHIWNGEPRKQGQKAIMNRVAVEAAMKRNIPAVGEYQAGVDVARYGKDRSTGYLRRGLKVIDSFCVHGFDTNEVAYKVWDMVMKRPDIKIKIDIGYNPGVADKLKELGAKVYEVNFGGSAINQQRYKMIADEMWFEFPINDADIPDDIELRRELCSRLYTYEKGTGRKLVESKSDYKERLSKNNENARSPDKADALLLCFYEGGKLIISNETKKGLALRHQR